MTPDDDDNKPSEQPAERSPEPEMPVMPPMRDIKEHTDPLRQK